MFEKEDAEYCCNCTSRSSPVMAYSVSVDTFHGFDLKYDELNQRLQRVKNEFGMRRALSTQSLSGETRTFAEILDAQVEIIVLYYLEVQGILAKQLRLLRNRQIRALQDPFITVDIIDELCRRYREVCHQVLCLLNYLDRNSVALRKILQRHDNLFDHKMGSMYFDNRLSTSGSLNHQGAQLRQLYRQEGILAMVASIRKGFEELHDARYTLSEPAPFRPSRQQSVVSPVDDHSGWHPKAVPRVSFKTRMASSENLRALADQPEQQSQTMTRTRPSLSLHSTRSQDEYDLVPTTPVRSNRSTGNLLSLLSTAPVQETRSVESQGGMRRSISDLEPVLQKIAEVGVRVSKTQERTSLDFLSEQSDMALECSIRDFNRAERRVIQRSRSFTHSRRFSYQTLNAIQDEQLNQLTEAMEDTEIVSDSADSDAVRTSSSSLLVNLLVTFLYQANQYIVAPTSAEYASRLGMSAAMCGLIIGLSPAAAFLSSLLYSQWTNTSFRQPLLLCVVCGVIGNLLYGAALQHQSVTMLMLGRLITGFGGPRVISRRYIADHVSMIDRLRASGQFVSAGALGLVFGPLIASLIRRSGVEFTWGDWMQYETVTAPGWIMAFLWSISLFAIIFAFEEPILATADASVSSTGDISPAVVVTKTIGESPMVQVVEDARESWMTSSGGSNSNSNANTNTNSPSIELSRYSAQSSSGSKPHTDERTSLLAASSQAKQQLHRDDSHFEEPSRSTIRQAHHVHFRSNRDASTPPPGPPQQLQQQQLQVQAAPSLSLRMPSHNNNINNGDTDKSDSTSAPTLTTSFPLFARCCCVWLTYISTEVHVILFVYFVNKVGQELVISSMPLLLRGCFAWDDEAAGYYMALIGALVVPTNLLIHRVAVESDERDALLVLTYWSLAAVGLVCHLTSSAWGGYTLLQYLLGTAGLFVLLNAVEGVIMSMLSKVIAPELARGTCNSGLLATEAGTVGRVIGDGLITLLANLPHNTPVLSGGSSVAVSISHAATQVVNRLYLPVGALLIVTVALVHAVYDRLID